MDGNSPIGEDKSGRGNNWTPVNFGGSVALDNPIVSGAKPILNTDGGGNVARPGVFGSEVGAYYAVTVSNPGSGNKYYLDGVLSANPTLTRGATYTFDQSDSSNSGHPLVFGTTAEGNNYSDGVTTSGTPGSAGAYTKITVPHNAPDTLYYHCSVHSGMGSSTSQITDETKADPYAWKNVLAVPFIGGNSDVSNQINSGSTTKADTNNGSTATNALSNFYNGSRDFDGSNDTCSFASVPACGAGDWTVEFWVYSEASSLDNVYRRIVSTGTNATSAIQIGHIGSASASGEYITYTHSDGSVYAVNTSNVTNRWAHIAVVRESGSVNVYTDGIKGTTADSDANNKTGTTWYVSGYGGSTSSGRFNGKIQDFRVYPGVAKYTSNFVVPATSPNILPDTPSGVSGGSKLTKITDGAVSFDGSGDYLDLPSSTDFAFGTGDFTMEFFLYSREIKNVNLFSFTDDRTNIGLNGSGNVNYYDGSVNAAPNNSITTNRWYHIAVTKSGTSMNIWLNGVSIHSFTSSYDAGTSARNPNLGARFDGSSNYLNGFISNFRVVKGTALYTSNFTPPTRELTNVTNTKLLCCQSNTSAGTAAVSPSDIITLYPISAYKEDTSSTNQTWDQSDSASSTSSALNHDELYWIDLGSSQKVGQVTFNVVASGQSSNTAVNYIIYYSTASNSTGSSVCNNGCTQTFIPVATGSSPGTYSVTVNFPTASSARYIAITNGNSGPGGTYVYSNVKIRPQIPAATNFNPFNN